MITLIDNGHGVETPGEEAIDPSKSGNEAVFTFSSWSDGVTSRERNIVLDSDMTLTANYVNPYDYGD